jgi:hypothetical protein
MILSYEKLEFWDTCVAYIFQLYQGSDIDGWYWNEYADM